jgi:pimeloyl-ACP methyl ester carboxylesterase
MFAQPRHLSSGVLMTGAVALLGGAAVGQTVEELRERFRNACIAQLSLPSGPAYREERSAKVSACVRAKFATNAVREVQAPASSSRSEFKLAEATPWLVPENRGPAEAKGVIYFVRGFPKESLAPDSFVPVPHFMKSLSEKGWDVLGAKVPKGERGARATAVIAPVAVLMRRRARELKAQGYKRVIVAGHSFGGWAALLAAQDADFAADALVLSAPNTFGQRSNPMFDLNLSQFPVALKNIKVPTAMILPDDPVWEPDPVRRGAMAEKHFAQAEVASFILAKPPGFTGHYAAWLPVFDYAYGRCIEAFIESPAPKACVPPGLSSRDFRSIVDLKQVADAESKAITSAEPLVGKKFVVYALAEIVTHHYEYVTKVQRKHSGNKGTQSESVTFRGGQHCAGGRCAKLLEWSKGHVLEFEAETGKLLAWWVEH